MATLRDQDFPPSLHGGEQSEKNDARVGEAEHGVNATPTDNPADAPDAPHTHHKPPEPDEAPATPPPKP